jgi:hypothetical protein
MFDPSAFHGTIFDNVGTVNNNLATIMLTAKLITFVSKNTDGAK